MSRALRRLPDTPSDSCLPPSHTRHCSGVLLLMLGLALLAACTKPAPDSRSKVTSEAAPVRVATVEQRDLAIEIPAIGTVEPTSTVSILPQVSGRITKVEFQEGALVKRNDPLFTIDTRPYNASLAAARAELARSQAAAEQAKAEAERYQALARQGLASSQEVIQRLADLKSTTAAIQAAHAAIANANLNVQFTTLRSPIDGRAGRLMVTAGNIVQPGGIEPLVVIRSLSPVKVSFNVPPSLLPRLRDEAKVLPLSVRATTRGNHATQVTGTLTFIDNTVDSLSGSVILKATFDNTDEVLWPGDFVDVVLVLGLDKQAIVAPEAAIAEGQQGPYAFVVDAENIAHFRSVDVLRRTNEFVVVQKGLAPGEQVVTDGILRLRDLSPVAIQPREVTAASSNASAEGTP